MSHHIEHFVFDENVDKKRAQAKGDEIARVMGRGEGASGLIKDIRWINKICDNYEEAERFIKEKDSGWYDQLAVMFREYPKTEPSKTLISLKERLQKEYDKSVAYEKAHSISSFKVEYIGCPNCGSKLKRTLLASNRCPLCRTDLRSKTTLDTLKRYDENMADLQKKIKAEERKLEEKMIKKSKIKWLAKIEYHT